MKIIEMKSKQDLPIVLTQSYGLFSEAIQIQVYQKKRLHISISFTALSI